MASKTKRRPATEINRIAKALDDGAPYKLVFDTFEGSATVGAQVVRRVRGGKIALKFPGSIKMGEVAPSPDLAKVVRFAELLWMRRRGAVKAPLLATSIMMACLILQGCASRNVREPDAQQCWMLSTTVIE